MARNCRLTGSAINISGLVGSAADALKTKLAGFFGNALNINLKVLDAAAAVKDAAAAAAGALASLKPGNAEELVKALDLQIINFASGSNTLSQARADAVKTFLIKQGVKADILTAKGYGSEKAIDSNDTEAGRFKNRRIEFSVVK